MIITDQRSSCKKGQAPVRATVKKQGGSTKQNIAAKQQNREPTKQTVKKQEGRQQNKTLQSGNKTGRQQNKTKDCSQGRNLKL